ncbi:MAG: hypothetical protein IJM25_03235 [Eubacterium sp.]|nr:hypothetical protein [Eubacterium sp.]
MLKGLYPYTNPYLRRLIGEKRKNFWWYFSLIIVPLGLTLYSPAATFIDRLDGVSKAAEISFWDELKENHLVPLLFGLTFLIVFGIGFFSVDRYEIAQWYSVNTAGRKKAYTPEEVDAEANAPGAEWLQGLGIILAPDIIIGFRNGIMVARYEDIELLKTETRTKRIHMGVFKWREAEALLLRPSGSGINELTLSETTEDPELVQMELDILRERCQKFHPDKKIKINSTKKRRGK